MVILFLNTTPCLKTHLPSWKYSLPAHQRHVSFHWLLWNHIHNFFFVKLIFSQCYFFVLKLTIVDLSTDKWPNPLLHILRKITHWSLTFIMSLMSSLFCDFSSHFWLHAERLYWLQIPSDESPRFLCNLSSTTICLCHKATSVRSCLTSTHMYVMNKPWTFYWK